MYSLTYWKGKLFAKRFYIPTIFFVLIACILLTNTLHESYPDEFDNILGGWYMLHGSPLYSGFFTHHNPIAYMLSAIIELFSWRSFVRFRLVYAVVLFGYLLWTYLMLKRRFIPKEINFYLFVILLFAVGATYFWGHMVLADNIAALFLLPVFALLFLKTFYNKVLFFSDVVVISILSSLTVLTAMTYSYLVAVIYLYTCYFYIRTNKIPAISLKMVKFFATLGIPYVIFLVYLFLTGSFSEYIYQNIVFNQRFYIYNYPHAEGTGVNPIRYAIVIAHDFYSNFSILLLSVKDFNFAFPFNITLAVVNTALIVYLILKRQFLLTFFVILTLIYANARTNPLTSSERDYQSSMYILLSFFTLSFVLQRLYEDIQHSYESSKKVIFTFLLFLAGIYAFFMVAFLVRKYSDRVYGKYMGTQPLIYNRPNVAPMINTVVSDDEYMWIGPFAFEELFYANGKVPSTYSILLPEFAKSPQIQEKMMREFNQNKPKVIYFDKQYGIRGYLPENYAKFFMEFLKKNYVTLYEYKEGNIRYISTQPVTEKFDIETKLYIRKDKVTEVIDTLLQSGFIKQAS